MIRTTCAGCGADELEVFLDLGKTPLADRFPTRGDEVEATYPLKVAVCRACQLVQQLCVVPDDQLFGDDYGFYTGASPSAVQYFHQYADRAVREFGLDSSKLVVEIACNDGTLLERLEAGGARGVGVEPANGPAAAARARGLHVVGLPFSDSVAAGMVDDYGLADLVVANNVAAHVKDPHDFFAGVDRVLAPDGAAIVEVQHLEALLAGTMWDHVYHEHRFFYSLRTLAALAAPHGLKVADVRETPAQGGSIRVVLTRTALGLQRGLAEPVSNESTTYAGFQARVNHAAMRLFDLVAAEVAWDNVVAGLGATAKSTTLLNYAGLTNEHIDYVVDLTPGKIGRYTPGTKIPIVEPGAPGRRHPDTKLVLAWNFLGGIVRREAEFLERGGRFIVPIPYPAVI